MSLPEPTPAWHAPAAGRDLDLVVIGDCNPDVLVLGSDVTPAFGLSTDALGGTAGAPDLQTATETASHATIAIVTQAESPSS